MSFHKCRACKVEYILQVAVALMRKMTLQGGRSVAEQAEFFAKQLHDAWGVGDAACQSGVVLLLSTEDRQVTSA